MSAADIVERAAALGVSLWIEGERIGIEGPARGVATIKPELAAHKPEVMTYLLERNERASAPAAVSSPAREAANDPQAVSEDCAGALINPDGGGHLPWGPYLAAENVRRLRAELFAMIDELAAREGWTRERYADTMDRAANGPLSDLLPNVEYFNAKVIGCRAEVEARALLAARSWRLESFEDRRGDPEAETRPRKTPQD